ncbi:glycosyltransferase family 2 protein [bacterium]|nr:glycosyltransferase family 2 protein [bacterium]
MISVVLPVYNEAESLSLFVAQLRDVLVEIGEPYEIVLVNDGSKDHSFKVILDICESDPNSKFVNLSRNFGHQIAISAGVDFASGDAIVLMDSDGQDPPAEIKNLYKKLKEGYDVVYAKRISRGKEGFIKKWTAKIFYNTMDRITSIPIPMDVGDFRILTKKVVEALRKMPEKQRYLRGQIAWLGFKQTYIEYHREDRTTGDTKYTYRKMIRLALDGITSFSNWPLRLATISGFVCAFIGFLLILYTLYSRYVLQDYEPGWASLMITLVFIGGIQLIGIGIIGEYIGRINENVKNRPLYVVDETNIERAQN